MFKRCSNKCKARIGICWNKNDPSKNSIKYCKRMPKKDGYCTQHYKIHIIDKQSNTEFRLVY
jgi:hypothetical protein